MSEKPTKGVLMEHMIFQKTRTQNLADVRSLNMWGYELDDVDIVAKMCNIETLALPINNISTLAPFSSCRNLKSLLLRQNQIASLDEIRYLQCLPGLTTLTLYDNPVAMNPNYREAVIKMLPQLQVLDEVSVAVRSQPRMAHVNSIQSGEIPVERVRAQPGRQRVGRRSDDITVRKSYNGSLHMVAESKPTSYDSPPSTNKGNDSNMLSAILALLPELTTGSLQIVLEAIQARCA
jgi:hypothetical protein